MIKSIDIRGLFGSFDYCINIPGYGDSLILTGPNGYGKSTILAMIEALTTGNLLYFYSIPFNLIIVDFVDFQLNIVSLNQETSTDGEDQEVAIHKSVRFIIYKGTALQQLLVIDDDKLDEARKKYEWQEWFDSKVNDDDDVFRTVQKKRNNRIKRNRYILDIMAKEQKQPAFMMYLSLANENSKSIPAQRLYWLDDNGAIDAMQIVSRSFKNFLSHQYFNFLQKSQEHDSKFIDMLMAGNESITEEKYTRNIENLDKYIDVLKKYTLSNNISFPEFSETKSVILNYYIKDLIEKYAVYDKPVAQLELFDSLLSDKMLINKSIRYSRTEGIRFVAKSDQMVIPLQALSSGEKNEVIMLHDFIFNLEDGSILLIDEPEISLHVAWQHEFLKDINRIAAQKKLRVIIATHSPQIIGDKWNLCYDLFYQSGKQQ